MKSHVADMKKKRGVLGWEEEMRKVTRHVLFLWPTFSINGSYVSHLYYDTSSIPSRNVSNFFFRSSSFQRYNIDGRPKMVTRGVISKEHNAANLISFSFSFFFSPKYYCVPSKFKISPNF